MNSWVYEAWMKRTDDWHGIAPVVVLNVHRPYPWECVAIIKEGPKSIVRAVKEKEQ